MARTNQLTAFYYSPLEISGYNSSNEGLDNNFRNPFVNLGDKIKLHSKSGTFEVIELEETSFTVSEVKDKWFIKSVRQFKCTWDDFRCWARKI